MQRGGSEGINCNLEFAENLGKKACVPSLEHGGGRDATKTRLSILKFSRNVASTSIWPENVDNWAITLIYYLKMMKNVTKIEEFSI